MRVVGIDLGTTNTAVAWSDEAGNVAVFDVPQLVTPAEIEARPLFPSKLYAPVAGEVKGDPFGDGPWVLGEAARRRGLEVPGRLVASAKSWLCHAAVDRTAPILPWGVEDDAAPRLSPVDASARVLAHVRRAWDDAFPDDPLALQEVVLTVPASFDEVARELTVEAAARAGLTVNLLEEPQAAFYAYMRRAKKSGVGRLVARHGGSATVLVCDVGGGTTDLSLIRVEKDVIERVAVGQHLLLGGDNMDLALAHLCEQRFATKLDPARFGQLVLACRAAKETLLGARGPEDAPVTVLGSGSKLVGGTLTTRLTRAEVEAVVLDGFLPNVSRDAKPERSKTALVAFGLPYEKDAAITRHLAAFFTRHAKDLPAPDAVLLNGGLFNAERVSEHLVEIVRGWGNPDVELLPHPDPDLAVALGAVAYGRARLGHGERIGGGSARGYYVGVGGLEAVCIVPRGTKEGSIERAEGRTFALVVGRPARFDVFASDVCVHRPGESVTVNDDDYVRLPPVAARLGGQKGDIKVGLEGELTPVGTLELRCVEADRDEPRRFRLAFQLRGEESALLAPSTSLPPPPSEGRRVGDAIDRIERVFGKKSKDATSREVKDTIRDLEKILGERASWPMPVARALFDALAPSRGARRRTPEHERIFWLLAGFCVRPGFGDPLDEGRVAQMVPLFAERLAFPAEARGWQAFWIAWRRMAGGLDAAAQTAIRDAIDPFLFPGDKRFKKPKFEPLCPEEMLDMAASLERAPAARRAELGDAILEKTWTSKDPRYWAALGRVGARAPGYASAHHVVPAAVAERWLDHLLRDKWTDLPTAPLAAVQLARMTGDRARDVPERWRREVEKRLRAAGARDEWVRAVCEVVTVSETERAAFLGEGLPPGLRLVDAG
jgi:molecular chaperone DnaK (HSP70)